MLCLMHAHIGNFRLYVNQLTGCGSSFSVVGRPVCRNETDFFTRMYLSIFHLQQNAAVRVHASTCIYIYIHTYRYIHAYIHTYIYISFF